MNENIKKIVITGDFLRLRQSGDGVCSQNANIKWLYQLINPALRMVTKYPVQMLLHTGNQNCIGTRIFRAFQRDPSFEAWVELYNKNPCDRSLAEIYETFRNTLVISFEMSELVRKGLEYLNIPYVDFTVHPVRFADDLIFGVRSNISGSFSSLASNVITDDEISIYAALARANLSRLPAITTLRGSRQVAVFAGQTTDDKVLIKNGKLVQFEDVFEKFIQMAQSHERILVKPHPYAKENKIIIGLTRLFPNTEITNENFYHLINQDSVSHVYSLTSSTSIEASYFGKRGVHLLRYPYMFSEMDCDKGAYLTIKPNIYLPMFWESLFENLKLKRKKIPRLSISENQPNRLRNAFRNYWGADIFYSF